MKSYLNTFCVPLLRLLHNCKQVSKETWKSLVDEEIIYKHSGSISRKHVYSTLDKGKHISGNRSKFIGKMDIRILFSIEMRVTNEV